MQNQTVKWQSMWPLLALLGALAAFGLGALIGVFGPSRLQIWARHEQVSAALDALLFHLRDTEDAQRDFLLQGAEADLRQARGAAAAAREAADRLQRLASQEFEQQRRTARLRALAARHLAALEAGLATRLESPAGRATILGSEAEQERMAEIRALASEVRREERRTLRRRLERADATRQVVAFVSGGAGLLLFGLLPVAVALARRNRRQLADAAEVLNQALVASASAAWRWDVGTRRLTWSEQAADLLGVDPARSTTTLSQFLELVHPDDREEVSRALEAAIAARGELRQEFRILRPDGSVRWLAGSGRFFPRRSADPRRMAGTLVDVTERKRAEHSLRFLAEAGTLLAASLDYEETLQNVARLAVGTIADFCFFGLAGDGDGVLERVVWAHRDPERQRELAEVRRFLPTSDGDRHPVGRVLRTGRAELVPVVTDPWLRSVARSEEHYRFVHGLGFHSLIIVPVSAGERVLGTLTFCRSARGASAYDAHDVGLAEELGRRAGMALENARLYLATREANAAKDQFLATLSHELRTPLTPVLAVVSALEADRRLPPDARERLATVRRNTELEARLIDDLLDLTRIERGKLDLDREVVDLLPLLAHTVDICRTPETEEKGLLLSTELAAADHRVWADDSRLSQVFWNLLKNAVKFTPAGGTIRVRSWNESGNHEGGEGQGEGEAEDWLLVEVSDSGIGIEPELLPRIFDAFEQGQRTITRQFGGLGLGLAISRAIVALHGGTLTAASEGPGHGATFTVRLPLGSPAAGMDTAALMEEWAIAEEESAALGAARHGATAAASPSTRREARPLHVLLVEDHEDTAEAMADLLRASGHRVTVAGSIGEALAVVETAAAPLSEEGPRNGGPIDLVVSDLGLPDGSGCDLMRVLAGRYGLRGIALSGYGMDEDVRQSREAGFERHLTKPVDIRTLETAIRESV